MKAIMVIGGMGSGKSTVCDLLKCRGASLLDLDAVGHRVLFDLHVVNQLVSAFGEDILEDCGSVSRSRLAEVAFATPESVSFLSSIMHPAICRMAIEELDALDRCGTEQVVVEASAFTGERGIFDSLLNRMDSVISITAPEDMRVSRAVSRGFDEADVRRRIASQPSDGQREQWADFVIENSGSLDFLQEKVDGLWSALFEFDNGLTV